MVDLSQYLPILIFPVIALGLSTLFVFLPMGVARLTGVHSPTPAKLSEYECGFPAFESPREPFSVRFYLVAISFLIFDLEAAFLFPLSGQPALHRLAGLDRHDDLSRDPDGRPRL